MNSFDDIQQLWQQSTAAAVPDIKSAIAQVRKRRRALFIKSAGLSFLLLLTLILLGLICYHYHFKFMSTRIGAALAIIAMAAAVVVNTNMATLLLRHSDSTTDNNSYLQSLKRYQQRARFMHVYGISIYFVMMGTGLILYMYEFVQAHTLAFILVYAFVIGWLLFVWLVLRPRTIKKQTAEIETLIEQVEKISLQLKTE